MGTIAMTAIEGTIISTAMPQIAGELGGLHLYSWVFSSYLLAQTATTVVFGKLADTFGRKPMLLIGIAIFLVGSVLAGLAWSMPAMILFRVIQGIGAGSIQPVGMTVVADLYPGDQRGKVQGYLASVWAVSSIVGPMLGGLIIRDFSWAWIFWINLLPGLLAMAGFILFLKENVTRKAQPIDIGGALLFTVAVTAFMLLLTTSGEQLGFAAATLVVFLVTAVLFVLQERRAADPMISFALWRRRPIAAPNGTLFFATMALMGLTAFLPMYVLSVLHRSPVVAGMALTVMTLGWPLGAMIGAGLLPYFRRRQLILFGSLFLPLGASFLLFLTPQSSPILAGAASMTMGFGMGLINLCSLVLIQEVVDWSQRGAVTSSTVFARNLGSTVGAALFGAVFNHGLVRFGNGVPIKEEDLRGAMEAGGAPGGEAIRMILQDTLHVVFWAMLVVAAFVAVMAMLVPSIVSQERRPVGAE